MFLGLHLWSLGFFPFVHSDEAWLASLTRTMMEERSFGVTEEFFRLTERHPHAIKSVFHALQMPFLAISFSHITARVLSLGASAAALACFGASLRRSGLDLVSSLLFVLLLTADVQFFYIAHLARQEILLVLVMCAGFAVAMPPDRWSYRRTLLLGTLLGFSIGVHPNAFIVTLPFFALLLWHPGGFRQMLLHALLLGATLAFWGILFVALSYRMDAAFLSNYLAFGERVGVADSPLRRFLRLGNFFEKLFHQAGGTYYLPPIRGRLVAFAAAILSAAPLGFVLGNPWRRRLLSALSAVVAVVLGLYLVGKYSPPSAIFLWPPIYLLVAMIYRGVKERYFSRGGNIHNLWTTLGTLALVVLVIVTSLPTLRELSKFRDYPYSRYIHRIRDAVPQGSQVLANLNTAFAFPSDALYVYRDLNRLESGIGEFLQANDIDYVVFPGELEVIFQERPQWNLLYGNLYPWYEDLRSYLRREGDVVRAFDAPVYGMRIVPYIFKRDSRLEVYRLD